ncbi:MAG: tRNA (N6-isopentenyl adenosine(37)-C2)-methylthiotransferase MiaB [candidate division Zixibacteria bacterium]|nr:tRNA (N6-isopentenyl adenosine(37)-C2)-methylthiotransferase MiaB [candidate division Zixibacteria bacterium]
MESKSKKFLIRTFGCQMNKYDSDLLSDMLLSSGWESTAEPAEADLVVYNTCTVREKAEQRALAHISGTAAVKRANPRLRLAVIGCMSERMGQQLLDQIPEIDFILGPDYEHRLPELIENGFRTKGVYVTGNETSADTITRPSAPVSVRGISAFVAISKGCENYCSYCIVPYVRGPLVNRPAEDIIEEINALVDTGVKEVTLLGQNVNSYEHDGVDFPDLLRKVDERTGIDRIRFTTSHPRDVSEKLFKTMAEMPRICESLHLPMQSGSDRILGLMNRGYSYENYRNSINTARQYMPGMCLTTDLIAGFPTETEDEFGMTLSAIEEIGFSAAFMFRYSARPGTKAAEYPDYPPEEERIDRLNRMIALQQTIAREKNQKLAGTTAEVLVDGKSRKSDTEFRGRDRGGRTVIIKDSLNLNVGDIVDVTIESADSWTLMGRSG